MFVAVKCFSYQKGLKSCRPEDGFFRCDRNDQCIDRHWVHTGRKDCKDGSDEGISKFASISVTYESITISKLNVRLSKSLGEQAKLNDATFNETQNLRFDKQSD